MKHLLAVALLTLLVGCGTETAVPTDASLPRPTALPGAGEPVRTVGNTQVQDVGGVTRLCLSLGSDAYECRGPVLSDWDWGDWEPPGTRMVDDDIQATTGDYQEYDGVRTGMFDVTGTLSADGSTFELADAERDDITRLISIVDGDTPVADDCPDLDPGDPEAVAALGEDGLSTAYQEVPLVDGPVRTALWGGESPLLVAWVHGDHDPVRAALRVVWPGPICLLDSTHSRAELVAAVDELARTLPGGLAGSTGRGTSELTVEVTIDDGTLQRWVDQEYGEGLVTVAHRLWTVRGNPWLDDPVPTP